jgi:spore coat polysaccharide biosynthesis protein SpsF
MLLFTLSLIPEINGWQRSNKQINQSIMLNFRYATLSDSDLYFKWTNDSLVRENSLNKEPISLENHKKWFLEKVNNPHVYMYVFINDEDVPVGQVIIEIKMNNWIILGQSVANEHRGKKYSTEMLTKSTNDFLEKFPEQTIVSVVKASNKPSLKMSINSGFNVLVNNAIDDKVLVLKGFKQHDESFILEAMKYYNLI